MVKNNPTESDLEQAYEKANAIHGKHLSKHGVKMPEWGRAKGYWFSILIYFSPESVHKDTISDITRTYLPEFARDQEVRHLKRDGWNLEGKGQHVIKESTKVSPEFKLNKLRLKASNFEEIKKAFGNRCASCGVLEGEPSFRYGEETTAKLQKGHKDPALPLTQENIIPQCQFCNRAYKNDFTFDDKGRVRAVASVNPVKRASKTVQDNIKNYLINTR